MKRTNAISRVCETCAFWRVGDLSKKRIGNVGTCIWAAPRSADFYARSTHAPYWMEHMTFRTTSWEGQSCATWELGDTKLRTINKNSAP